MRFPNNPSVICSFLANASSLYTREPLRVRKIETSIKVTALWEFHRAVILLEVIFIREMLHYIFNTAI